MRTCSTCIYWVLNENAPPMRSHMRQCISTKLVESIDSYGMDGKDMLIYPYDEGGYFSTGPDFGCVHHRNTVEADEKN